MELVRGWYSKDVPEKTGQIRLCKATVYRDIVTDVPGIRDDKEGKTRLRAEGTVRRRAKDNWLPETTVELALNDGEISGTAHLAEGSNRAALKQEISTEIYPVPYIFCASQKPESADEERALKEAFSNRYDEWYTINDAETLGRELEKAINGWLFDRQVTERRITKRYGWVNYYEGDRPEAVADISDEKWGKDLAAYLFSMQAWFNKRKIYEKEAEYRYAYVIESPQLQTLPDCIFLDLTMSAIRMLERT